MPHKVITERIGFTIPAIVAAQADIVFTARNEDHVELILRIMRAVAAGKWEPNPLTKLPRDGKAVKIQLRLRPQDIKPYRDKCGDDPISFPVAHGLWIYAHTPDPADLPF